MILVLGLTATALGHHVVSIGCEGEDIEVVANVFGGHRIIVEIDGIVWLDEEVPGENMDHTWTFPYPNAPATVEVFLYEPDDDLEDYESKEVSCFEAEESEPEESEPEGSVGGGTGTPVASIPDTAAAPTTGTAIGTLAFGVLLLLSLGSLAYANVRAGRR
jgi:hypothetical protein